MYFGFKQKHFSWYFQHCSLEDINIPHFDHTLNFVKIPFFFLLDLYFLKQNNERIGVFLDFKFLVDVKLWRVKIYFIKCHRHLIGTVVPNELVLINVHFPDTV